METRVPPSERLRRELDEKLAGLSVRDVEAALARPSTSSSSRSRSSRGETSALSLVWAVLDHRGATRERFSPEILDATTLITTT